MKKKKNVAKLVREARKSLGFGADTQQALLRRVREGLGLTNEELANALGVSLPTLMAWLAPETAAKHRRMPDSEKLLLRHLVERGK